MEIKKKLFKQELEVVYFMLNVQYMDFFMKWGFDDLSFYQAFMLVSCTCSSIISGTTPIQFSGNLLLTCVYT